MIPAILLRFMPHIGIALVVGAVLIGAYQTGVNSERNRGEAATLRITVETMLRDKKIAEDALARVSQDAAQLEALRRTDEEKIDQLQQIIRDRADPGLNQRELDGLLNIR